MAPRYALYCAPRSDEALASFARGWLGYDAEAGIASRFMPLDGLPADLRLRAVTEPRRYGFHGTLKAPFALASGLLERDFVRAVSIFSRQRAPVAVPLELATLGRFLALVPAEPVATLMDLAADCVRDFARFRAPPDSATLARRRAARLTEQQDRLLVRWGYPYVLDQFRFHLTLTGPLEQGERDQVQEVLRLLIGHLWEEPFTIRDLAIFIQPAPAAPFQVLERVSLAGGT